MLFLRTPQMLKTSSRVNKGNTMNNLTFMVRIVHVCVEKKSYTQKSLGRERVNSWALGVLLAPRISRGNFFRVTHDGLSERGTTSSLSEATQ